MLREPQQFRRPVAGVQPAPGARVHLPRIQLLLELPDLLRASRIKKVEDRSSRAALPVDTQEAVPERAHANRGGPQSRCLNLLVDLRQTPSRKVEQEIRGDLRAAVRRSRDFVVDLLAEAIPLPARCIEKQGANARSADVERDDESFARRWFGWKQSLL